MACANARPDRAIGGTRRPTGGVEPVGEHRQRIRDEVLDHREADREPEHVPSEPLVERPEDEPRDRAVDDVERPAGGTPVRPACDEPPEDRDIRVREPEQPPVERLEEPQSPPPRLPQGPPAATGSSAANSRSRATATSSSRRHRSLAARGDLRSHRGASHDDRQSGRSMAASAARSARPIRSGCADAQHVAPISRRTRSPRRPGCRRRGTRPASRRRGA